MMACWNSALRLPTLIFAFLLPVIFVIVGALRPLARPRPELAHQSGSLEYLAAECCLPRAQRIRRFVGVERAAVELPARSGSLRSAEQCAQAADKPKAVACAVLLTFGSIARPRAAGRPPVAAWRGRCATQHPSPGRPPRRSTCTATGDGFSAVRSHGRPSSGWSVTVDHAATVYCTLV